MTVEGWNRFVDGFDVKGFADQMADALAVRDVKLICYYAGMNGYTLDWPCDPKTGLIKDFGSAQLKRIAQAVKGAGR